MEKAKTATGGVFMNATPRIYDFQPINCAKSLR